VGDVIVAVDGKPVRRLSDFTDVLEGGKVPGAVQPVVATSGG
jgi:S1-C subfamily serine protease